ncbi:hypothetical protein AGLY_000755, partial [Aphis glycines]
YTNIYNTNVVNTKNINLNCFVIVKLNKNVIIENVTRNFPNHAHNLTLLMLRTFLATALTRLAALGIANSNLRFTPVLVDVRTVLVVEFKAGGPIAKDRSLAVVLQDEQTESVDDEEADFPIKKIIIINNVLNFRFVSSFFLSYSSILFEYSTNVLCCSAICDLHCFNSHEDLLPSKLETEPSRIIKLRFLKHILFYKYLMVMEIHDNH